MDLNEKWKLTTQNNAYFREGNQFSKQNRYPCMVPIIHHTTCRESLLRARQALVVPKKRTLEELVNSKNVKSLVPPLPREVAVSFYLQSWKLIFAVYHMVTDKGVSR